MKSKKLLLSTLLPLTVLAPVVAITACQNPNKDKEKGTVVLSKEVTDVGVSLVDFAVAKDKESTIILLIPQKYLLTSLDIYVGDSKDPLASGYTISEMTYHEVNVTLDAEVMLSNKITIKAVYLKNAAVTEILANFSAAYPPRFVNDTATPSNFFVTLKYEDETVELATFGEQYVLYWDEGEGGGGTPSTEINTFDDEHPVTFSAAGTYQFKVVAKADPNKSYTTSVTIRTTSTFEAFVEAHEAAVAAGSTIGYTKMTIGELDCFEGKELDPTKTTLNNGTATFTTTSGDKISQKVGLWTTEEIKIAIDAACTKTETSDVIYYVNDKDYGFIVYSKEAYKRVEIKFSCDSSYIVNWVDNIDLEKSTLFLSPQYSK